MAYMRLQDSPCPPELRIVLVGKTGAGKSSLGNILHGEKWFKPDHSASSGTAVCKSKTKEVMDTQLTLIDTPGLVDTKKSEENLKSEIIRSIMEFAPGAHAFLIVLKVERYTKHEEEIVKTICQYFTEEMLKYSVIVFTHGDQLEERTTIQQFVDQNQKLKDLVRKCGGRCHVFDSRHWKNNDPEEEHRSNSYQLKELLSTVKRLVKSNKGDIYTNEILENVDQLIMKKEEQIRQSENSLSDVEIREEAKHQAMIILKPTLERFNAQPLLAALFGTAVAGAVAVAVAGAVAIAVTGAAVVAGAVAVGGAVIVGAAVVGGVVAGVKMLKNLKKSQ